MSRSRQLDDAVDRGVGGLKDLRRAPASPPEADISSGLELALWFVQHTYGPQTSTNVEMVSEYERRGLIYETR